MEIRDQDLRALVADFFKGESGPCPDEEDLASFLEEKLYGSEREEVAQHVFSCERCRDALAASAGDVGPAVGGIRVPSRAERMAVELVPRREAAWEIVVRFVAGAIQVIKNTGDQTLYFPQPAYNPARGPGAVVGGSLVAFTRYFAGLQAEIEIEIERVSPGISEIKVTAQSVEGIPPKNLRFNLYKGEKELMSYMLQGGSVTFDKVEFGNCMIDFTRRGIRLGEIALEIKGE